MGPFLVTVQLLCVTMVYIFERHEVSVLTYLLCGLTIYQSSCYIKNTWQSFKLFQVNKYIFQYMQMKLPFIVKEVSTHFAICWYFGCGKGCFTMNLNIKSTSTSVIRSCVMDRSVHINGIHFTCFGPIGLLGSLFNILQGSRQPVLTGRCARFEFDFASPRPVWKLSARFESLVPGLKL